MREPRRLPTPRQYAAMAFEDRQATIEQIRELMFTYLLTERGNDVRD